MKIKKLPIIIIILCMSIAVMFGLTSCGNEEEPKVTVTSIKVVETSIPESVLTTEVDDKLDDIQILITKSDNSTETINLSTSMIPSSDLAKLDVAGTHTITVKHQGKQTTFNIVVTEPVKEKEYFTVKVLYPDGTPVAGGVTVQWCDAKGCNDAKVNDKGIATLEKEEGEYEVHLLNVPEGYTHDPHFYTSNVSNKNIEIKLVALSELTGEGTSSSPFVVSTSAYSVTFTEEEMNDIKYFSFIPTESGNYTLKAFVSDTQFVDPYLGFLGSDINGNPDVSGNIEGEKYFDHTITDAQAGTTYYFMIMLEDQIKSTQSFDICISKN